jgi:signal transduction histidine kinase
LFSSFTVIPHILTFPGAFDGSGLPGVDVSTSAWLFFSWRIAVPLGVISYAVLGNRRWRLEGAASSRHVIALCVAGVALLALAVTLLITRGQSLLPDLMSDDSHFRSSLSTIVCLAMAAVSIAAMAMVWRCYGSILDLWLLLMLWVGFLEYCLNASISGRFSLGWYVLKAFGCISSLLVLVLLLVQANRLYLGLIAMASAQERERQRQLLVRDAIAASIAHEMRQPLAAISINAETALKLPPGDILASGIIQDILDDSHRANNMISSTRDLYKKSASTSRSSNLNQLIRDTLAMDWRDLQSHGVTVELTLAESLPNAVINRLQMQQVFMNLFMNAAEAMSANVGPRILKVRSEARGDRLVVSAQDTGPGIDVVDHERIFTPFFTTKDTGTGLGLAICQSVVEGHGGTLRAVQRSGLGALFEVELPCEGAARS